MGGEPLHLRDEGSLSVSVARRWKTDRLHRQGWITPPQHTAAPVGALLIYFFTLCLGKVLLYTALASTSAKSYSFGAFRSVIKRNSKNTPKELLMKTGLSIHQVPKHSPGLPKSSTLSTPIHTSLSGCRQYLPTCSLS